MFSYLDKLLDGIFGYQKPDTSQLSTSKPPALTTVPLKKEYFVKIEESATHDLGLLRFIAVVFMKKVISILKNKMYS